MTANTYATEDFVDDAVAGASGAVSSVNSETGAVVLDATDVGADPAGTAASFASAAATALSNHEADTTAIHGIADTSALETTTGAAAKVAAEAALARNADNLTSGTVADARIASTLARDSEVTTAVAAEATLARNADNLTSGTVADARIASTIARDSEVTSAVAAEATARDSAIATAVANLIAGAPGALDTLDELAAAFGDDANFAATMTTALAGKQPLDSDLTAIAALTTTSYGRAFLALANAAAGIAALGLDADVATLSLPASTTISAFGASLIDDAAASNARTTLGLGTAATSNTGDFDAAGAAAAAQAASQPLDADLTTLAGLTATTDNMIQSVGSAWASRTPAQVKTALALNNLDNTSDANKPVSTAQQTALNLKANLASPALTGSPTAPTQSPGDNSTLIATDAFVNAAINAALAGLDVKPDVAYAATSALPACTYANGTSGVGATLTGNANGPLLIDGVTLLVAQAGQRVLIAAQAAPEQDGWYTITQVGVVAVSPFILTRATESDQAAEIGAGYLTGVVAPNGVTAGANNGKLYISVAANPFVVGTTALTFSQVGSTYSAGTGIGLSGTTFSIDTAVTVDKTTAQTLTNKTLTSPAITTPTGIVKGDVGLGNVLNSAQLVAASNLSDLANAGTARTNLGLVIGTNVQAFDADLTTYAGITPGALGQAILPMTTLTNHGLVLGAAGAAPTALAPDAGTTKFLKNSVASDAPTWQTIAESDVTNLTTDLAAKAPLASPPFTGSPKIGSPSYTSTTLSISGQVGVEDTGGLGLLFIGTGFGVQPALDLRRVNGSFAVPAKVASGDVIASINVGACTTDTTTPPVLDDVAQIWNVATETFSATANGNEWRFYTTPNASSTKTLALTIGQDQSLTAVGDFIGASGFVSSAIDSTNALVAGVLRTRRTRSGGAINSADVIGSVVFQGHDGTIYGSGASIAAQATQAWTGSAKGTKLVINVIANGATTLTPALTIDQDTSVTLAGALTVAGILSLGGGVVTVGATGIANFGSGAVVIGTAGNYTSSGFVKSTGQGGVGYATGAGGAASQATSRTTTVVLNAICGTITLFSTTLAADTDVSFTWTNSSIAATDVVVTDIKSGAAVKGGYSVNVICGAGTATVTVHNHTPTITATEAPVIAFAIIKGVTS